MKAGLSKCKPNFRRLTNFLNRYYCPGTAFMLVILVLVFFSLVDFRGTALMF